jgi:PhoH-like ATPase
MRILAHGKGVNCQNYDKKQTQRVKLYTGLNELDYEKDISEQDLYPNEYVLGGTNGISRYSDGDLIKLGKDKNIWGIRHLNVEQRCAIDALMNDDIKLVTMVGRAGSGKTLLAIAAGLEKVVSEAKYHKILISRPIIPMGNDIGFLPGNLIDKLGPWMQPIFDNIDFLFYKNGQKGNDNWAELEEQGLLKIEALTYIRGRSIPEQFIIIDEAQNLTKHEVLTILTRVGENTKIILTGDPGQIDNPKLDSINNGLSYVVEKFKDQKIAAHIEMKRCERSELADIASKIL